MVIGSFAESYRLASGNDTRLAGPQYQLHEKAGGGLQLAGPKSTNGVLPITLSMCRSC